MHARCSLCTREDAENIGVGTSGACPIATPSNNPFPFGVWTGIWLISDSRGGAQCTPGSTVLRCNCWWWKQIIPLLLWKVMITTALENELYIQQFSQTVELASTHS